MMGAPKVEKKVLSIELLDERTINLADTSATHYLRLVVELEVVGPEALGGGGEGGGHGGGGKKEPDKYKARLMDKLILTISAQHYRDLLTVDGKEHLKEKLKEAFNEIYAPDKFTVKEVLYTDFVME
jgi:flagellar basal body-associated protein FliL